MQINTFTVFVFPSQSLLSVHDTVAQRDFEPTLPPIPDDVLDEDEDSVKIVSLVKTNEPLVSTRLHVSKVEVISVLTTDVNGDKNNRNDTWYLIYKLWYFTLILSLNRGSFPLFPNYYLIIIMLS